MLFFVFVAWKSGRSSYYAARAPDAAGALGAVRDLLERYSGAEDVVTGEAWEWPGDPAPACPMRNPDGPAHAFKLRSRPFTEHCLTVLGVLASQARPLPRENERPQAPPAGAKRGPQLGAKRA